MRDIKFRGLRTDNNEWIYGSMWNHSHRGNPSIMIGSGTTSSSCNGLEVTPETVGQFTGLKDKTGKDIYEGDMVQTVAPDGTRLSKFKIIWSDRRCRFMKHREDDCFFDLESSQTLLEVIGNIHETPKLLNN